MGEERRDYYRVTCQECESYVTVMGGHLTDWMLSAPNCPECGGYAWTVGEPRTYAKGSQFDVFDQEAEDEAPTEFRPIPFSEDAIKKEFSTCMAELHLWLASPEGAAAQTKAQYDPKGPWS